MNIKESLPHALGRKTLDAMIRREYGGWPPITPSSFYQPHRPEKPLPKPQDKTRYYRSKNRVAHTAKRHGGRS